LLENLVSDRKHPYFNKTAVLTSNHHKHQIIAPAFSEVLGITLKDHSADTDQLGTFSGEVDRTLSPKKTAVLKARIGMKELGVSIGVASEGSIGLDPQMPFAISDIELLVLVDDERQIEIFETYRSFEIAAIKENVSPGQNLEDILVRAKFPGHKLIVSANQSEGIDFHKAIGTIKDLQDAIQVCAELSEDGLALIQSDLRAHCSPTRAQNIKLAAGLLATRVATQCSRCASPGWGKVGHERGLDCAQCGLIVSSALRYEVFGCVKCEYVELGRQISKQADPATCSNCNP
jgi:hypothetical protein